MNESVNEIVIACVNSAASVADPELLASGDWAIALDRAVGPPFACSHQQAQSRSCVCPPHSRPAL